MEAVKLSGLIVIKDSIGCSGERLWISYVERCRRKYNNSRLLLTYEWPDTLERRYECVCREGISLEPLNSIQYLLNILNKLNNNNNNNYAKIAFFIDSFNMALLWSSSCDQLLRLLKNLSEYGIVVIRIHDENLSDHIWQRVMAVANTVHSLRLPSNSSNHRLLVCETISYKKNGRQIKNIELFEVNEEYKLCCSPYKDIGLESTINNININSNNNNSNSNNNNNNNNSNNNDENSFDEMLLPFDIGLQLSDDELRAKRNLKLPFMAAQTQQGLVGISASGKHKVRAGGRIIYTPDEADDLDDSDPDDDLQI